MAYGNIDALVCDLLLKIPDAQVMADLDATAAWGRANGAASDRLAATGFCWGGRWTWLYAAHRPLDAAVAWYGILDGTAVFPRSSTLFPRHPIDLAGDLKTPVLGLYGGRDEAIPRDTIVMMQTRLAQGGAPARASRIELYDDAPHAFFADYRATYRSDPAIEAWANCLAWLGGHGQQERRKESTAP